MTTAMDTRVYTYTPSEGQGCIDLGPGKFNSLGCGCLEATLLHELLHVSGVPDNRPDHVKIKGIEGKCFNCPARGIPISGGVQ